MRLVPFALTAVCLLPLAAPAQESPAEIVPHRAVYSLSLLDSLPGSGIGNVVGDMVVEIEDRCDGWESSTAMRFQLVYEEGTEIRFGTLLSAWEAKDGLTYRFQVKRRASFHEPEDIEGEARLDGPGEGGTVRYGDGLEGERDLPPGTLFPTRHAALLAAAAAAGESRLYATVFDGTEQDSLYEINALVAGSVPEDQPAAFDSPLLETQPSWRIALGYFESGDASGAAHQELTVRLFENGIIDEQFFDFGLFTMRGTLITLEEGPAARCG